MASRLGHSQAVDSRGIWLRFAGTASLVYDWCKGMSVSSSRLRITRPAILLLEIVCSASTVESLSWTSVPLTSSFLNIASLTKLASDWSSSKAYTMIFYSGLPLWYNHTSTMSEWDRQSSWFLLLWTSTQCDEAVTVSLGSCRWLLLLFT